MLHVQNLSYDELAPDEVSLAERIPGDSVRAACSLASVFIL
jgi:hypothetical protein